MHDDMFPDRLEGQRGGRARRVLRQSQEWQGTSIIHDLLRQIREAGRPLTPVFRTDSKRYTDVTVPFVWIRGKDAWDRQGLPERSNLWVDIPDAIYRHIQSQYAEWVMRRWFGRFEPVELLVAHRLDVVDRPVDMNLQQRLGTGDWRREIVTEWSRVVEALELTAEHGSWDRQPAKLSLFLSPEIPACVVEDRLELNIQALVRPIRLAWAQTLKEQASEI